MPASTRPTRLIVALAAALLLAGAAGVVLLWRVGVGAGGLGRTGERLEDWVGAQLVGIADSYLVPSLAYDEIDYSAPATVSLEGVTLTAPDGTVVLALPGLVVTLAQTPRLGDPIVIETLVLRQPAIRLIRETDAEAAAGFKGLSPLVRRTLADADREIEENFRLSNVLRLRRIEIVDGAFHYDASDGSPPMAIAGLTTTVEAAPAAGEPGWYALDIDTSLGPLARAALAGVLSLDTFVAKLDSFTLAGSLASETIGALPPQLQELAHRYAAQGEIDFAASGTLPLTNPLAADLRLTLRLEALRVASGDYHLPVDRIEAEASLAGGVAELSRCRAELLTGTVEASGGASLADTGRPARLDWTVADLELRELLRIDTASDRPPSLAGKLTGAGSVALDLDLPQASLSGGGELRVRQGSFLAIPIVRKLAAVMDIASARLLRGALAHEADAEFLLDSGGVRLNAFEIRTEALAARGSGTVGFDGALDLVANAGPLEKVQSMLGPLGEAMGVLTDRLVKYRIGGVVGDPRITVEPLGLGG